MNKPRFIANVFLWGIGILALFGSVLIVFNTAKGLSGGSDAAGYVVSARNVVKGLGVGYFYPGGQFHLLNIHPPLYVLSVAWVAFFKIDVVQAARILDVIYFSAVLLLAGYIFHRFGTVSSFSLLAALVLAAYPPLFGIYHSAMTESLYFLLFLGSIFCLLVYQKNHLNRWWIVSATLIGLSVVTRYDGIAILPVGLTSVFLFDGGTLAQRFKKAALFGLLAILPLLIFGFTIHFNLGQPALGRDVNIDWSAVLDKFQQFRAATLAVLWSWLPFPGFLPIIKSRSRMIFLGLILVGAIGATLFAESRNKHVVPLKQDGDFQIFAIFALSFLFTIAFLIFTFLVFGLPARVDDRQLLPLYISAAMGLLAGFACWQKAWFRQRGWIQGLAWVVAGVFIFWDLQGAFAIIIANRAGSGPLSTTWQNSELVKAVSTLPQNALIISNRPDILLYWADRPAYDFILELQPGFIQDEKAMYGSDPSDRAQVAFREQGAALVIFGQGVSQDLANVFGEAGKIKGNTIFNGLTIGGKYPDGTIYFYPK